MAVLYKNPDPWKDIQEKLGYETFAIDSIVHHWWNTSPIAVIVQPALGDALEGLYLSSSLVKTKTAQRHYARVSSLSGPERLEATDLIGFNISQAIVEKMATISPHRSFANKMVDFLKQHNF